MPLPRWTRLSSSIHVRNPWWTYKRDAFRLPSGAEGEYHYVHTNGSSLIVPVLSDGRLALVNQYRYLCDRESLEFPCGGVKDNHTYDDTATQELEEEAGLIAREWLIAGEFDPYNGVTNEICRVYVARGLTQVPSKPDMTEEFEILRLTPEESEARMISGVIWDGMTMAAWSIVRHHL